MGASVGRRVLGIAVLWGLAALLAYIALDDPPGLVWQVFLLLLAFAAGLLAEAIRKASGQRLELTDQELRERDGAVLCTLANVRRVDRTMFANKPSSGFLVTLVEPGGFVWRPGLWWRVGRRVGVGGMTTAADGKTMADMIAAMVEKRKSKENSEA